MNYSTAKPNMNLFRGTESEILNLRKNNKIVNYCFYFAWDTGNFYLGTSANTLQKYGSGKSNISITEIKQIASEMINNELIFFTNLVKQLDYKINTSGVDRQTVLEILDAELTNRLNTNIIDNSIKQALNKNTNNFVKVISGDDLLKSLKIGFCGYYYVTENSTDMMNTFIQGNTYYIDNTQIKNITFNSYLANNYVTPKINILSHNIPSNVLIGRYIDIDIKMKFIIDNIFYVEKGPVVLINNVEVTSFVEKDTINFKLAIENNTFKKHVITIKCIDIRGNTIEEKIEINVLAPIYYGSDDGKFVLNNSSNEFSKLQQVLQHDACGSYEIDVKLGEYCWFLIPSNINFNTHKIYSSGFNVPFIYNTKVVNNINNTEIEYNCYRTTYALSNGTYFFEIKE